MAGLQSNTPIERLREYRDLAPWSLRDLASLCSGILQVSRVSPVSRAARSLPNERTIRFYVAKGIVRPPDGKGPAATYSYRHLLTVLAIKLRQMEGADLATIAQDLAATTGDTLERRVATALGDALPGPDGLDLLWGSRPAGGRAGRVLGAEHRPVSGTLGDASPATWHRIVIEPHVELHVADDHPLTHFGSDQAIADAVGTAMARLLGERRPRPETDAYEST